MVCLLFALGVEAQSEFGGVTYTVPAGWNGVLTNDTFLALGPDQLEPVEHLVLGLMLSLPAQPAPAAALDTTWSEVLSTLSADPLMDAGKRYQVLPPIQTSDGRTLLIGDAQCSDADGT